MTKAEFLKVLKEKTEAKTLVEAEKYFDGFLAVVEEALIKGDNVQFVGWGAFEVKDVAAKVGRNPKTGVEIQIPAKKAVRFKAGKKLADKVNG